jgi:2-desacetyl-2-hydroxyethyl bacteriochlorophyllide A dehydrogenase
MVKALVYTGVQRSEIQDVELTQPEADQVVVDLAFCGLCGSDMHAWHGHDERRVPPLVLGHEAVGVVEDGHLKGKRVAINPLMTCGRCPACLGKREHLCPHRELIGMRVPGAFAEKVVIAERNLTLLPDHLSFREAALAEPLACSVHGVRLALEGATFDPDAEVVILGGGAIGLLAAFVFRHEGFANIRIAETSPHRRQLLEDLGLASTYDPRETAPAASSIDIVYDAVGSKITREASSDLARPGGTIVHIGLQDNEGGLDTRKLTLQEIRFRGTYCYQEADFATAIDLLARGIVSGEDWAEIRPLDDGAGAFIDVHNGTAPPKIILETR